MKICHMSSFDSCSSHGMLGPFGRHRQSVCWESRCIKGSRWVCNRYATRCLRCTTAIQTGLFWRSGPRFIFWASHLEVRTKGELIDPSTCGAHTLEAMAVICSPTSCCWISQPRQASLTFNRLPVLKPTKTKLKHAHEPQTEVSSLTQLSFGTSTTPSNEGLQPRWLPRHGTKHHAADPM